MYFGLNRDISPSPILRFPKSFLPTCAAIRRLQLWHGMHGFEAKPRMASLELYAVLSLSSGSLMRPLSAPCLLGMRQTMRQDRPSPSARPHGNKGRACTKEDIGDRTPARDPVRGPQDGRARSACSTGSVPRGELAAPAGGLAVHAFGGLRACHLFRRSARRHGDVVEL